jgi:hypothetical protein
VKRRDVLTGAGVVLSLVTGYYAGHAVQVHERALGLYCAPSFCGPDDLPFCVMLITSAVCGVIVAKWRGK